VSNFCLSTQSLSSPTSSSPTLPMNLDDYFELGAIVRPHGVRGQVVFEMDADDPSAYGKLKQAFVLSGGKLVPIEIQKIQFTGDPSRALLTLAGITTMDQAETLRDTVFYLPLTELPPLTGAGQFYYHEVVGFALIDEAAGLLGPVRTFYELPQHDVLAVDYKGFEVLVPVNDEVIRLVDREAKELHIVLPAGLLDIYTQEVKEAKPRRPKK
jgi:16S rRNA processing protein RimM